MGRVAVAGVVAAALALAVAASGGAASEPPSAWDGANPFACELQDAGMGATVKHPDADPFCIEFDKRHQNVTQLGVVEFLSKEPARVAAAVDKCFYFQSDHWRAAVVQDDGSTKLYEWDGHYFFDKAKGDGGAWVTNFNVNGRTGDPTALPGFPPAYAPYFGPGTGGVITHDEIPADPACVAKAAEHSPYAAPAPDDQAPSCRDPRGGVSPHGLGGVALGTPESRVWAKLGRPARVERGFLRYCLPGGRKLLIGVPGDRSGTGGSPGSRPATFLLTTHPALTFRGIGRGDSRAAVRRAFPRARVWFVLGRTQVLRLRPTVVAGVRDGRVRLLAVFDTARVPGAAAVRAWLRRSA